MMNVLNMGSMNIDYVYEVDHIVVPGETQSSRKMKVYCGGKGLNQSVALARAGVSVAHAGIVGEDGGRCLNCAVKMVSTQRCASDRRQERAYDHSG